MRTPFRVVCLVLGLIFCIPSLTFAQLQPTIIQAGDKLDAIAIHITPRGPWPKAITHVQGPLLLYVSNRSGTLIDTYSLIQKASGSATANPSLLDLHSTATSHHDHQLISPLPGEYQIIFQSHPDWLVNVTITAK